jgi:hypothetical protein
VAAFVLAANAAADVVDIPCARDATLWNDPAGNVANGSGPVAFAGRAGSSAVFPIRRALVRFDVAAHVPAGATIRSAQLVLSNSSGNVGPQAIELRRVLADWGEGASSTTSGQGAPAQSGDATWIHTFFPQSTWTTAGGDAAAASSATLVVDQLGVHAWPSTAEVVGDVQGWLDQPSSSFGWLVLLSNETVPNTTKVFDTREATDPARRPKLVVDFDPPPQSYCAAQPTSLGCVPSIGWSGAPSASPGAAFSLSLADAPSHRPCLLVYGSNGRASLPFLGSTLCVAPPLRRLAPGATGGSTGALDCSGSRTFDFQAWISSGLDPSLAAGSQICAQWLGRDAGHAPPSFFASDALEFAIAP